MKKNVSVIINEASIRYPGYEDLSLPNFIARAESYDNIYIGECLSYLAYDQAMNFIKQCLHQLNKGGLLIIQNFDIVEVAAKVVGGEIDIRALNSIIANRASCHSLFSILEAVRSLPNIEIELKDIENLNFILQIRHV